MTPKASTRRRRALPAAPPCVPVGELWTPRRSTAGCSACDRPLRCYEATCDVPLHLEPDGRGIEWRAVGPDGSSTTDRTPVFRFRRGDEVIVIDMHDEGAWDRLAEVDLKQGSGQVYPVLSMGKKVGMFPFFHLHNARPCEGPHDPRPVPVPECCNRPMWAAADGWHCRVTDQRFDYPEGP